MVLAERARQIATRRTKTQDRRSRQEMIEGLFLNRVDAKPAGSTICSEDDLVIFSRPDKAEPPLPLSQFAVARAHVTLNASVFDLMPVFGRYVGHVQSLPDARVAKTFIRSTPSSFLHNFGNLDKLSRDEVLALKGNNEMTIPEKMFGVVLTGHGGLDKLEWHENLDVPVPENDEVLIKVHASGVNNTDINTRTAWYSKSVRGDTESGALEGNVSASEADGSWSGNPLSFPLIQGADACGEIVAVGPNVPSDRIGERVLVRALQTPYGMTEDMGIWTFGSECNGGFAEYAKTYSKHALPVLSDWSDLELASIPCAYSTAENMLQRINLKAERVLVTGASGGVGSAAIQLAARRGAEIIAMTSPDKAADVLALGAKDIIGRDDTIPDNSFDAVIDLVAGPRWEDMINGLKCGGRYITAGAIAGPIVELDVRTLYLRDLTLYGSTYQPGNIMEDIIRYIERGELKPLIAEVFDLKDIRAAQESFINKKHIGKIVLRH